jgi:hypothetical protein
MQSGYLKVATGDVGTVLEKSDRGLLVAWDGLHAEQVTIL